MCIKDEYTMESYSSSNNGNSRSPDILSKLRRDGIVTENE